MELSVGAFEAKTHFSELLARAEQGENILITRRGQPVARLVPAFAGHDVEKARAAVQRLRAWANSAGLGPFGWEEWKSYRDEGRR
jgi:prevent-host-death family protein